MLKLTYKTDDVERIQRAEAYWRLTERGEWANSVPSLSRQLGLTQYELMSAANSACDVHIDGVCCNRCERLFSITSRAQLKPFMLSMKSKVCWTDAWKFCPKCVDDESRLRRLLAEQKEQQTRERIAAWIESAKHCQSKDYERVSLREAFLLFGLLSLSGNSWQGDRLASWSTHRTKVFACDEDTIKIYNELYVAGWLTPCESDRPDSITIDSAGDVQFYPAHVSWNIAPDIAGAPITALMDSISAVLGQASIRDLHQIWIEVCLSELKAQFNQLNDKFGRFSRDGWTPQIELNMRELLRGCSLSDAHCAVHLGVKNLNHAFAETKLPIYIKRNLVPGAFLRVVADRRSKGYAFWDWGRKPVHIEAVLTGYLFDTLLIETEAPYTKFTGNQFDSAPGL